MASLSQTLIRIQEIANEFDGSISLKNEKGQYFYVNEKWLQTLQLKKEDVMGKTDAEIFPEANALFIEKSDLEVAQENQPIQYLNKTIVNDKEIVYIAMKWVVNDSDGNLFCTCTLGDLHENQDIVNNMQKKLDNLLNVDESSD